MKLFTRNNCVLSSSFALACLLSSHEEMAVGGELPFNVDQGHGLGRAALPGDDRAHGRSGGLHLRRILFGVLSLILANTTAEAANPTLFIDVVVCAEFQTSFNDFAAGDNWTDEFGSYEARGVEYLVQDEYNTLRGNLNDQTGCVDLALEFADQPPVPWDEPKIFEVTFSPNALVNGVNLQSYVESSGSQKDLTTATQSTIFAGNNIPIQGQTYTFDIQTGGNNLVDQQWQNLAVGTYMFSRSDFHIFDGVSRNCCMDYTDNGNPSGSCTPNGTDYEYLGPPVFYVATTSGGNRSRYPSGVGNEVVPAIATEGTGSKFIIAHETGHVVVALRMGTSAPKSGEASLDNCMADWKGVVTYVENGPDILHLTGPSDCDEGDPACPDWTDKSRANFTKEYDSMASNEGWANFVAMWAWNDRTEPDCTFHSFTFSDLDLDGDVDNFYPNDPDKNHWVDCEGTPIWSEPDRANNPIATYMDSRNWLDDLETASDPAGCTVDAADEENRSTVNDWAKLFWDLNNVPSGQGISMGNLADLYVDMCPLAWAMTDMSWDDPTVVADPGELPLERLKSSANHHFLATELRAACSNVEPLRAACSNVEPLRAACSNVEP